MRDLKMSLYEEILSPSSEGIVKRQPSRQENGSPQGPNPLNVQPSLM